MLQQYDLKLIVYADNAQEAQDLQNALNDFVVTKYKQGVYPRASKISQMIKQFGSNKIINQYIQ